MVTNKQSRLEALRASLSNMTYEQSSELPGNWGAGSGWREGTETLSRISTDEIKTHCRLACTLCAPQNGPGLGCSAAQKNAPHSSLPSGAGRPPLSSPVLAASISQQPLISTPEPLASIWQAVGGFDGLLFLNMKLIWFFRVMAGKQNLPIGSHTRPPEAICCVLQLCHYASCL